MGALIFFGALVVVAIVLIFAGVKTVSQGANWTVERFGRYTRTLQPGLHLIIPFIDTIGRKMNMQENVLDIPAQKVITKDNATVQVDAVAFYQVVDAANPATVVWSSPANAAVAFPGGWSGSDAVGDTYRLDLSAATLAPGSYRVASNGLLSAPFAVAADAYDIARLAPLEFFRIQRADAAVSWTSLDGATGGHGPDHLDDARQATRKDKGGGDTALIQQDYLALPSGRLDVAGGWSDAGDYNKYMGNTPWAAYLLLLTAEERPAYWARVDVDADGVPDLRQLVIPALDWMLKMQWTDGSVFERVFNGYGAAFDGRPDLETDGVPGTADDRPLDSDRYADITAKAVYAWATGYRVLGDPRYLAAAERAWDWAYANRTRLKPKVYGGGLYFGDLEQGLTLGAVELHRAQAAGHLLRQP